MLHPDNPRVLRVNAEACTSQVAWKEMVAKELKKIEVEDLGNMDAPDLL